jgi:hypothetical protein
MMIQLQQHNCFVRNGGKAIPKHVFPEALGCNPTTDLPCSGLVTDSGEMLTTDKSHKKEARRIIPNDDTKMRRVLQLKYATWNIKRARRKEEEE